MDIDKIILEKERLLSLKKNNIELLKDIPYQRQLIEQEQQEIKKLEDDIKYLREVRLAEAKVPKKSSLENIWIYIIVSIIIGVISIVIGALITNLLKF